VDHNHPLLQLKRALPWMALCEVMSKRWAVAGKNVGLDHGVGHSLLLLYNVKVPNGQKSKEFKGLGHYPSHTSLDLF